MKIKSGLIILAIGLVIDFIGTWLKITHQTNGDLVLTIAALLKIIGLLLFIFSLFAHPKVKEFLEYDQYTDSFK